MKYKYTGDEPCLIIEVNKEVSPGDVIDVDIALNSAFFIPVQDKQPKEVDGK